MLLCSVPAQRQRIAMFLWLDYYTELASLLNQTSIWGDVVS